MSKSFTQYLELQDQEKIQFMSTNYINEQKTVSELAEEMGTYPNRVRRELMRLKFPIRSKSETQSLILKTGRVQHPTAGKPRSEKVKRLISDKNSQRWKDLTPEELEYRKQIGKDHWESLSEEKKQEIRTKSAKAIRKSSQEGSILEKWLCEKLIEKGYKIEFHKEHIFDNEKLQIDIYIPQLTTAIEINGPSHYKAIWGENALRRSQIADGKKTGLLLGRGSCIIHIIQQTPLSEKVKRTAVEKLLTILKKIKKRYPPREERLIEITV